MPEHHRFVVNNELSPTLYVNCKLQNKIKFNVKKIKAVPLIFTNDIFHLIPINKELVLLLQDN